MKKVAIYARVSTDKQGESLDNQVTYAQEFIRRSLDDEYVFSDELIYQDFDTSGYYTRFVDRPAIQKALNDARISKYEVIVFKEISRISRDQAEHIEIISRFTQYNIRIIAINDNLDTDKPETLDMLGIRSWMSEMESKRISSRVSSGKKGIARRGLWVGEPPIGYKVNPETKKLMIDEAFAEIPATIFQLYTEGNGTMGTFKIAEFLNEKGLLSKNGKLWSRVTVNRVLKNRVYIGEIIYGKTKNNLKRVYDENGYSKKQTRDKIPKSEWIIIENAHPPLVTKEIFEKAQLFMSKRAKQNPRRTLHPLTGILKCDKCGRSMVCQKRSFTQKNGNVMEYRYYVCATAFKFGRNMCDQINIHADKIEKQAFEICLKFLEDYRNHPVHVTKNNDRKSIEKKYKKLDKELEKTRIALDRLFMSPDIPEQTFANLKMKYVTAISQIENEQNRFKEQLSQIDSMSNITVHAKEYIKQIANVDLQDLDGLHKLFHEIMSQMIIFDNKVKNIEFKLYK